MTTKPNRLRLLRFLEHERRHRLNGLHGAVKSLHRRSDGPSGSGRLRHYLSIERGRTA